MMKKLALFFLAIIAILPSAFSNPVNAGKAQTVAKNIFYERTQGFISFNEIKPQLIYTESRGSENLYYVFNIVCFKNGFVIVAADDDVVPVLAYSMEGLYTMENFPVQFAGMMNNYRDQIIYVKENKLKADESILAEWERLTASSIAPVHNLMAVSPLLTTTWDQNKYYNRLCPLDAAGPDGRVYAGCVATAMGQVMKYHNHPAQGSGSHSYYHSTYGNLSANFGMTTYNWGSMPNSLSSNNTSIATLLYHCGISVEMNYGPSGSGAYTEDVANALKSYFDYASTAQFVSKSSYTTTAWEALLKAEIDNNRPMVYKGSGPDGGHAFVLDGYQGTSNNHFHFNWGWSGYYNGYFYVSNLNPGTYTFTNNQGAVIGVKPNTTATFDMRLYGGDITVTPNPIIRGKQVSVHLNVGNYSSANFSGSYAVSLFDDQGNYVTDIEELNGMTLTALSYYTSGLDFVNSGLNVPVGNYLIAAFYKPDGGSWTLLDKGSYSNPITVTITSASNPTGIALYSDITVTPDPIEYGQSFDVSVDFANWSFTEDFYGNIAAVLHNTSGAVLEIIDTFNNRTLETRKYFDDLTFTMANNTLTPGNYLISIQHKPSGQAWQITDQGSYTNPIQITVNPAPLNPDMYEANNSFGTAYTLPVSFSGNVANVYTTGSNLHLDSDTDYYKIVLPAGAGYTIKSRVHDSRNSGNGNVYTCDVMYSYKDLSNWSTTFNDAEASDFVIPNGGIIYFKVQNYFTGKGTYLLDIRITRTENLPDLIVLNENVTPLSIPKGSSVAVSCTVKNQNATAAASSLLKYYISLDDFYSVNDVELGSSNTGSLNASETVNLNKNLIIPETTANGNWYIIFRADANSEVNESNENNNTAAQQITVTSNSSINNNSQTLNFEIFPNPAISYVNFRLNHSAIDKYSYIMTNTLGEVMLQEYDVVRNTAISEKIDIQHLLPGVYFLRVFSGNESMTQAFIVE